MSFLKYAVLGCAMVILASLPGTGHAQVQVLKTFPLDSLKGVITTSNVSIEKDPSATGGTCLKIVANKPTTIHLFEVSDLEVENAKLVYQARLRTKDATDKVYLEMWCRFPGKGEFFSRGLDRPLTGTTGWITVETPFFLKKGEKPDLVKLNVGILGKGTVWVEDVKLIKALLN